MGRFFSSHAPLRPTGCPRQLPSIVDPKKVAHVACPSFGHNAPQTAANTQNWTLWDILGLKKLGGLKKNVRGQWCKAWIAQSRDSEASANQKAHYRSSFFTFELRRAVLTGWDRCYRRVGLPPVNPLAQNHKAFFLWLFREVHTKSNAMLDLWKTDQSNKTTNSYFASRGMSDLEDQLCNDIKGSLPLTSCRSSLALLLVLYPSS